MTCGRAIVLAACVALAGCATGARRDPSAPSTQPAPVVADQPAPPAVAPTPPPTPPAAVPEPAAQPDAWAALGASMRFVECDDSAAVRRWIRVYSASPPRFTAMFERALPFLSYVQSEIARRGLPGEFVLLPMVESSYVSFATKGNRPAGIWQFMPATARHFGLAVGPEYDGRRDVAAATRAALEYLEYLGRQFEEDWPLVNMAFNAGEYRVRGALTRAQRGGKAVPHDQLALSPITHEHFAKLSALSCLVRDPARWHVELPPAGAVVPLAALKLDAATDLALVAAASGTQLDVLAALNPAARDARLPAGAMVLLPAGVVDETAARIAAVPGDKRTRWRVVPAGGRDWGALARDSGLEAAVLAGANGSTPDVAPPVRVAMHDATMRVAARVATSPATDGSGRYAVRSGDSLWTIAKRFGVTVASLLKWNSLPTRHVLRPGQLLRVAAPD